MAHVFLKIDGITGTGTGARKDWLPALSVTLPSNGSHSELNVTRIQDSASPRLFKQFSEGRHIPNVLIETEHNGKTVLHIELSDVLISGMQISQGHPPSEHITFHYIDAKFEVFAAAGEQALTGGMAGAASRR